MKCVKLKGPKKLELGELEEPVSNNGNVVIEVKKTGICGSDLHFWDLGQMIDLVLGHEFSGVVIDSGSREDLKVGDRVTALPFSPCGKCAGCKAGKPQYCPNIWNEATGLSVANSGGLAEKLSIRPDMVLRLPDNVTDEEGAMVEPAAVGLHAVHLANMHVGDKVLVIGAGIIGLVTAMFAKMAGASYVAISETNALRGEKSVKLGVANEWFDAKDPKMVENVMVKTNGGFDKVFDCCGNSPTISTSLMTARPGGEIILVGISLESVTVPAVLAAMHEVTIKGVNAYEVPDFEIVIDLMASKRIDMLKFVDDVVGFEEVQKSYERLSSGADAAVKILVDPKK